MLIVKRAKQYYEKAILKARENADTTTELESMRDQALLEINVGNKSKGMDGLEAALSVAKAQHNAPLQLELLESLAQCHSSTDGPTKKSVELLEQAAIIAKDSSDHTKEAHLYFQIAEQYSSLKDKARSIQFYKECLVQAKNAKDMDLIQKVKDVFKPS
jgi:hypothetical protein